MIFKQHNYYYNQNQNKIWNFNCVETSQYAFISFKTFNKKLVTCNQDLCNSISFVESLEDYILCEDGFYSLKNKTISQSKNIA